VLEELDGTFVFLRSGAGRERAEIFPLAGFSIDLPGVQTIFA
jgi:hypothetical protein